MENSDLIDLFNTLTVKELKGLSAFIQSPYTSKGRYREEVQNLFNILTKYTVSGSLAPLDKEKVYKLVFPDKPTIVQGHLERVMFELHQIIRTFLVVENYLGEGNSITVQLDYADVLKSRGLLSKSTQVIQQTLTELKKEAIKTADQYGQMFEASSFVYNMASQNNKWKDDLKITETLQYLDLYYSLHKLNLLNHYLLLSRISRLDSSAMEHVAPKAILLPNIRIEDDPNVFIAYKIYLLLSENQPTKAGFDDLLQLLTQYEAQLNAESIKLYFSCLRNYCVILIMHGHLDLLPVIHLIHIDNLNKGYFTYEGKIPPGAYHNIANTALRAKNTSWALTFIEEYKDKVFHAEQTDEVYRLNMASYFFHTQALDKALDYLPPASNDLEMHLNGRRLELKIYYELRSDLLTYKLDAFKMYISRASKKLLSDENRERHANFVNLLLQLEQIRPGDTVKANRILDRIEEKQRVAEKEWLLEKAQKLLKR